MSLYFSAERGDSVTTFSLLRADGKIHHKDNVLGGITLMTAFTILYSEWVDTSRDSQTVHIIEATLITEQSAYYWSEYKGKKDYANTAQLLQFCTYSLT